SNWGGDRARRNTGELAPPAAERARLCFAAADLGLALQRPPEIFRLPQANLRQILAFRFEWDSTRYGRDGGDPLSIRGSETIGQGTGANYIARNTSPDFFYRVAGVERTMLLCGYNTKLTSRSQADRLIWLLMGRIARYLIPTRLRL